MQSSRDYQRLTQACQQEGCLLCRLAWEDTHRYLETWKDEMFTDVSVREELRRSQGFCNSHTWQLVQLGASLPLAQAYRDILTDTLEHLDHEQATRRSRWFDSRRSSLELAPCPACQYKDQSLKRLIATLREALLDAPFYTQFAASIGLCLPHLTLAQEIQPMHRSAEWLPLLRQAQLTCLQRINSQLSEMIRKHDYRFKDEARGEEMISWKSAAALVASEDEQKY